MILCLDIGNSHIVGGIYATDDKLQLTFRYETSSGGTSDQLGTFLKNVLRDNNIDSQAIKQVAICSVAPQLDYSMTAAAKKYFDIDPFILQAGVKTGIKIKYSNPLEVGADFIAESIAAVNCYPDRNVIVVDFGTATTFGIISKHKEYLGGVIIPGLRLAMESLQSNTAKLPTVRIIKPTKILGTSTVESIQAGLYFSHEAAVKEINKKITAEVFKDDEPIIIGTGGFSHLFADENMFTKIMPNIVLDGLLLALKMNINP